MGVREIIKDAGKLSEVCHEVDDINDWQHVIQNLRDTAKSERTCVGLAANQLGYGVRIFIIRHKGKWIHFINPSFTAWTDEMVSFEERCLSFPGKVTKTRRYALIKTYGHKKGKELILSGIEAIAFQHELDHLNGICI